MLFPLYGMPFPWHFCLKKVPFIFQIQISPSNRGLPNSPYYWHSLLGEPITSCSHPSHGIYYIIYMPSPCREESCFITLCGLSSQCKDCHIVGIQKCVLDKWSILKQNVLNVNDYFLHSILWKLGEWTCMFRANLRLTEASQEPFFPGS